MSKDPTCQQCGTEMNYGKIVEKSLVLQLLGVALFIIGLVMLIGFPLGTIIGIILMIVSARLGYSKKSGWKCGNCGYFFESHK